MRVVVITCILSLSLCGAVCAQKAEIKPFRANLLIASAGSWMVLRNSDSRDYYNKFTATLYGQIFSVKTVIAVPLDWTAYIRSDTISKDRFAPGDLDLCFGKRIGWMEPRLGIIVPMGYAHDDLWKKKAWIGTNNVRLQTGVAVSRRDFEQIGLPFGVEAMVNVAMSEKEAHYKRGSIGTELYIKSSFTPSKKTVLGAELAVYGKNARWVWNGERESSLTLMPTISVTQRMARRIYAGCKTGFGPSFRMDGKPTRKSNALDLGVSVQYYP